MEYFYIYSKLINKSCKKTQLCVSVYSPEVFMSLEINLFIDPLSLESYKAEQTVLKVAKKTTTKLHLNFIAINNIKTINAYDVKDQHYNIALDTIAASFQGKKYERAFLIKMQEALLIYHQAYSDQLVNRIVGEIGLDKEMFDEDRRSQLTIKTFKKKQQATHQFENYTVPSIIAYDTNNEKHGALIKDFNYQSLLNFLQKATSDNNDGIHFLNDDNNFNII